MTEFTHVVWLGASFLILFAVAEWLYYKRSWDAEHTRKVVHIGTGLLTLLFPVFLHHSGWVLLLCGSFALILLLSIRLNLLPSINKVERVTVGSLCYPLAVYTAFLANVWHGQSAYFYVPILIMALSDPAAALVGKRFPLYAYRIMGQTKSLGGNLAFFLTALLVLVAVGALTSYHNSWQGGLLMAAVATLAEAVSTKGWDNVTIPWSVLLVMWLT